MRAYRVKSTPSSTRWVELPAGMQHCLTKEAAPVERDGCSAIAPCAVLALLPLGGHHTRSMLRQPRTGVRRAGLCSAACVPPVGGTNWVPNSFRPQALCKSECKQLFSNP